MEFHSFARRNERYLWVIAFAILFVILTTVRFESLYVFLRKNPALLFLSITALIAYKSYVGQRHLTVAKNTIEFQTAFHNSKDLKKATKYFVTVISRLTSAQVEGLAEKKRNQEPGPVTARELLNSWERVAVAVRVKVYDEEMLFNTYSSFLITVWETLSPYVQKKREENPKFFVEVQWLAIRWRVRKDSTLTRRQVRELRKQLRKLEKLLSATTG
jgi:hypothetical protein